MIKDILKDAIKYFPDKVGPRIIGLTSILIFTGLFHLIELRIISGRSH